MKADERAEVADMIGKSIGIGVRDALMQLLEHHELAKAFEVKFEGIKIPVTGGHLTIASMAVEVTTE